MTDNYPDDIRQYDDSPGSPFYVEPLSEEEIQERLEAEETAAEDERNLREDRWD